MDTVTQQIIPVLNITTEQLVAIAWASLPGVLLGVVVTLVLLYIRSAAEGMRQPEVPNKLSSLLAWPIYFVHVVKVWFVVAFGLFITVQAIPVSDEMKHVVRQGFSALAIVQMGMVLSTFVKDGAYRYLRRTKADGSRKLVVNMLVTAMVILIWVLMLLAGLDTFGVNVTALLAGLGLGGIAIAFATKNLFENVLASFAMVLDPPFVIGDFIVNGDVTGTVERITLKNVQIRALSGEQVTVPNAELLNGRIRNYARMKIRRVVLNFGVTYAATPAQVAEIPKLMKKAITAHGDAVAFDRAHFMAVRDGAFWFEGVYNMQTADYTAYMDVQQAVLLDIYKGLEKMGVQLAVPTQLTYFDDNAQKAGTPPKAKVKGKGRKPRRS